MGKPNRLPKLFQKLQMALYHIQTESEGQTRFIASTPCTNK